MSRIKEFYHEEICRIQEGENLLIDDEYFFAKWQAQQVIQQFEEKHENLLAEDEHIENLFNSIQENSDNAQLPLWMNSNI